MNSSCGRTPEERLRVPVGGYNTQVPLSLPDTKQHLQPHIIIGHSPKRLVAVCCVWKRSTVLRCRSRHIILFVLAETQKSRQEALRSQFLSDSLSLSLFFLSPIIHPRVLNSLLLLGSLPFCKKLAWLGAHSVGERTHCKLKQHKWRSWVTDGWLTDARRSRVDWCSCVAPKSPPLVSLSSPA